MFDIQYYFCRHGGENITTMTKETFKLEYDSETEIAYVKKVKDELTKNHREKDSKIVTGFMPQIIDPETGHPHRLCPVRSFENYLYHLHPEINSLWQKPRARITSGIWFEKHALGHNPHEIFMGQLSSLCDLSQRYTNHCIRVTGATNLRRRKFNVKQVMAVTGHKCVQSLALYQRVEADEKMMMGMWLTYNLYNPNEAIKIRATMQELYNAEQKALREAGNVEPVANQANVKAIPSAAGPLPQPSNIPVQHAQSVPMEVNTMEFHA